MHDAQVQIKETAEYLQPFCLFLWAWKELVLVSDFQMGDVVSVFIHGTLQKETFLSNYMKRKWKLPLDEIWAIKIDGLQQLALLRENKNIPEGACLCPYCNLTQLM